MGRYDEMLAKSIARKADPTIEFDGAAEQEINQVLGAAHFGKAVADRRERFQKSLRAQEEAARAARMPKPTPLGLSEEELLKSLDVIERLANGELPPAAETPEEKIDRLTRENEVLRRLAMRKKGKSSK